jgi:hypothetical protein
MRIHKIKKNNENIIKTRHLKARFKINIDYKCKKKLLAPVPNRLCDDSLDEEEKIIRTL